MTPRGKTVTGPKRPEPPWFVAAWLGVSLGALAMGALTLGALSARPGDRTGGKIGGKTG